MCGIGGWLGQIPHSSVHAHMMLSQLAHRGPDGHGTWSCPDCTLVHTRLSIIDLSPAGEQPFLSEDKAVSVVCNGEIYNHHDLRHWLEQRGHIFAGRSDCEVIPHLWEEEGPEFVRRLRGMFALALYDSGSRTLFLARDRFGIKPLYYARLGHALAFSSEIGPLLQLPEVDRRPSEQAISDYVALCYVPGPQTLYRGIWSLEPGTVLEGRANGTLSIGSPRAYHRWTISPNLDLTLDQAAGRAEELIVRSVSRQMETDVPLGALLSGGIDSSLVCSAARQALPGSDLLTFNVRFPDVDYDETWAATAVARWIGSTHQTLDMQANSGTWDAVTGLLRAAGQPFADTSIFAVNAVSQLVRQYVTVALSGDGGDEQFGGYSIYHRIGLLASWQAVPPALRSAASLGLRGLCSLGVLPHRIETALRDYRDPTPAKCVRRLLTLVQEDEQSRLWRGSVVEPVWRLFEQQWQHDLSRKASGVDRLASLLTESLARVTLPYDFLFKVDMASMREGLEVRVPLLDEDLFAFALTLPHRLKATQGSSKRVLREIARRRLPQDVAARPKAGFAVPVDKWVEDGVRAHLRRVLIDADSPVAEFLRPEAYRGLVSAFCERATVPGLTRQGLYQRVVMLLALHLALEPNAAALPVPDAAHAVRESHAEGTR